MRPHHALVEDTFWARHGVERHQRRVRLPRLGVEVRVQESGQGPDVLFVPPLLNPASTYVPLVAHLDGFRCLLVDRPGTATSEPLTSGWARASPGVLGPALLADLLDALDVSRSHVVAGSFGGTLALTGAATHPERIDRMVQLGCPAFVLGMATPAFLRLLTTPAGRVVSPRLLSSPLGLRLAARLLGHGATVGAWQLPDGFVDWACATFRTTPTAAHELDSLAVHVGLFGVRPSSWIPGDTLAAVTVPTAFYWGDDDVLGSRSVAERTVAAMPSATLSMIARAGHLPWLDDPPRAAAFVAAHLAASRG